MTSDKYHVRQLSRLVHTTPITSVAGKRNIQDVVGDIRDVVGE